MLQLYFWPMACSLASRITLMEAGIEARYHLVHLWDKKVVEDDTDFWAVSPKGAVTPMGTTPRIKPYKVAAVFEIGMSEYDASLLYMPLGESQAYFNRAGDVTAIEVYIDNPDRVDRFKDLVTTAAARPIFMVDWHQRNATFFNALQVERKIGKVIAKREQAERLVLIDIRFPDFDETAIRGKNRKAASNVFARERVENNVDPIAAGRLHNFVGESEGTRVQNVRHSHRLQVRALLRRAGGRENFRAGVLSQLHGGEPHATSRGVNEHALSAGKLRQMVERIVGR